MLPTYPSQDYQVDSQTVQDTIRFSTGKMKFQFSDRHFSEENLFSQIPQKYQQTNIFTLLEEHIHASQENTEFKPNHSTNQALGYNPDSQNCFHESNFESNPRQQEPTHAFQSNNPITSSEQVSSRGTFVTHNL